ncbi:MAG: transcription elongation factor GreAB [Deltaproteobacteria bacterium HGW-Deltaproteobacteria-15]|jgi:regulator of nucleoside diphosphate kinase|nr:MAG: transcription elongation factor GreAB [Deltaproteobacteria bacterium HGW-Deltaproteobacteria-15]
MQDKEYEKGLYVTEQDLERLEPILASAHQKNGHEKENLRRLNEDLERARVVDARHIPADVVAMNSMVHVVDADSGEEMTFTLVFPEAADFSQGRISVLAPIGSAVLGYRTGDVVEWKVPAGTRRLKIVRVLGQPGT